MLRRILATVIVLMLAATACGSDATDTAETTSTAADSDDSPTTEAPTTTEVDEDFSGDDSGDFCEKAREFDENDPFDNVGLSMSPAFFEEVEEVYGSVISMAPDEIRPDFEATLNGLREMQVLLEKYDYNFFDESLAAEMDALDSTGLDASSDRIGAYLEEVCGIENALDVDEPGGLEGIDPADFEDLEDLELDSDIAQSIFEQFGIDEELGACLEQELGSDFDFDSATADPGFMTQEVCGTTILEIISGIGQG